MSEKAERVAQAFRAAGLIAYPPDTNHIWYKPQKKSRP